MHRRAILTLASLSRKYFQALCTALEGLLFTPDPDSNALNTDDLASVTITADDLGFSGGGGAQESEPLTIRILVKAVNDRPLLDLPSALLAMEDVPFRVLTLRVSDVDVNETGGKSWGYGSHLSRRNSPP